MPKDPICGMEVEESKALKLEKNGETYFFCSKGCQDKFLNKIKESSVNKKHDSDKEKK
jgi:YHS domain-containing protein